MLRLVPRLVVVDRTAPAHPTTSAPPCVDEKSCRVGFPPTLLLLVASSWGGAPSREEDDEELSAFPAC